MSRAGFWGGVLVGIGGTLVVSGLTDAGSKAIFAKDLT